MAALYPQHLEEARDLLNYTFRDVFPGGFRMIAIGSSNGLWAPIGFEEWLYRYPLNSEISAVGRRRCREQVHHWFRTLKLFCDVAPKYAPAPVSLIETPRMDIPIIKIPRAGNMTMFAAFYHPSEIDEEEQAMVWLQVLDCMLICSREKIKMKDLKNPRNIMINWHQSGDTPHVKLIDCDLWTICDDSCSDTERAKKAAAVNTKYLMKLVKDIWEGEIKPQRGPTFFLYELIHSGQFSINEATDMLQTEFLAESELFAVAAARLALHIKHNNKFIFWGG